MKQRIPIAFAILAAVCYGISVPFAKLIQESLSPAFSAALIYLGAGLGMGLARAFKLKSKEAGLTKADLPFTFAMVLLDIAAPLFLMFGLSMATAATVSLLGNFEIVATSIIALIAFKEAVGKRMWLAIALITASSMLISVDGLDSLKFSPGALLVLCACACWGIENNCTSQLSLKDPIQIVIVKGFGSGLGSLAIAFATRSVSFDWLYIALALLMGFVSYGLSIYFYILAQRHIGAARTSAYYAFAPFIGVAMSFAIFGARPSALFLAALAVMVLGAYLAATEKHMHEHEHAGMEHEHRHRHDDGHHGHSHIPAVIGEHSHLHTHPPEHHAHLHAPDLHHMHGH